MLQKSLRRRLYDYFIEHWVISTLLSTITGFLFTGVQVFGENIGFRDTNGALTPPAFWFLGGFFIFSFLFTLLMSYGNKYDEKKKKDAQYVLQKILVGVNEIKHAKLRRFIQYIDETHETTDQNPFHEITQPKKQLENILGYIQDTLSDIFDIQRDSIGLSVIYRTDVNSEWSWFETLNIDNDLSLGELINNPRTTVREMIDSKLGTIFYADKRLALSEGHYVLGKMDDAARGIGSIICKDISIDAKNKYVEAILSITTYGRQICVSNDEDAKQKILSVVLPPFERRIQLELALLYIKEVIATPVQPYARIIDGRVEPFAQQTIIN